MGHFRVHMLANSHAALSPGDFDIIRATSGAMVVVDRRLRRRRRAGETRERDEGGGA